MAMTRALNLAAIACAVAGCSADSPDYGAPSDTTKIAVREGGGFAPPGDPAFPRSVAIAGTTAVLTDDAATGQVELQTADVAAIIDALADLRFLELDTATLEASCEPRGADFPLRDIEVELAAGANT